MIAVTSARVWRFLWKRENWIPAKYISNFHVRSFVHCIANVNQCVLMFIWYTTNTKRERERPCARFSIEHCEYADAFVCVCVWLHTYGSFRFRHAILLCAIFWRFSEWIMAQMNAPCCAKDILSGAVGGMNINKIILTKVFFLFSSSSVCERDQVITLVIVLVPLIFFRFAKNSVDVVHFSFPSRSEAFFSSANAWTIFIVVVAHRSLCLLSIYILLFVEYFGRVSFACIFSFFRFGLSVVCAQNASVCIWIERLCDSRSYAMCLRFLSCEAI